MQSLMAVALASTVSGALAQSAPLAESSHTAIQYSSPGAALDALRADPGVIFTQRNGWIVASDAANHAVWSFAPKEDPAYPSVVKRDLVEREGKVMINMSVHCEASKAVCDDLVRKFLSLNEQVKKDVQNRLHEPGSSLGK
jgi:hypothetical protein